MDYIKDQNLKLYLDFITSEGATLGGAFVKMYPTHSPDLIVRNPQCYYTLWQFKAVVCVLSLLYVQDLTWSAKEEEATFLPTCAWKKVALRQSDNGRMALERNAPPSLSTMTPHLNSLSWDVVQGVKHSVDTAAELLWKIESGCMADISLYINDQVATSLIS